LGRASTREPKERPFVVESAEKLGDLYWRGELTDEKGNRWNVWILPGIAPSLKEGGEAWLDAADYVDDLFEGEFWADRGENFTDGIEFAFVDSLGDFMIEGIADSYVDTGRSLSDLADETPFGWIPRMAARAIWGFVFEPIGRIVGGTIGFAGGISYSISMPVGQVVVRPVGGTIYAVAAGVIVPVARIAVHQPA